jgi:chromosome partitioning protein
VPALLVDLDPQAHLTAIHGKALERGSQQCVRALSGQSDRLQDLAIEWEGLGQLIPAHAELIKVDSIFGKGPAILNRLNSGLQALEAGGGESHHHRLLPFPRRAFVQCHICRPTEFWSRCPRTTCRLRGALQIEHTLKALEPVHQASHRAPLRAHAFRPAPQDELRDTGSTTSQQFGVELCETVISENVAIAEAPAMNRDIFAHQPEQSGGRGLS